jgi:hypothetical protein
MEKESMSPCIKKSILNIIKIKKKIKKKNQNNNKTRKGHNIRGIAYP